jgi:hypothetical protein
MQAILPANAVVGLNMDLCRLDLFQPQACWVLPDIRFIRKRWQLLEISNQSNSWSGDDDTGIQIIAWRKLPL